jgi:hypothetical protein
MRKVYKNLECRYCHSNFSTTGGESQGIELRVVHRKGDSRVQNWNRIECIRCGKWSRWYLVPSPVQPKHKRGPVLNLKGFKLTTSGTFTPSKPVTHYSGNFDILGSVMGAFFMDFNHIILHRRSRISCEHLGHRREQPIKRIPYETKILNGVAKRKDISNGYYKGNLNRWPKHKLTKKQRLC